MRIAMMTNNYKPFVGGVPISVERQAEELVKQGNDVTIFAPEYEEEADSGKEKFYEEKCRGGLRVVRFPVRERRLENGMAVPKLAPKEILPVFEEEWFDVIHTHHPMFVGPMALYLGRKYDLPVVYTYHTRYEDYLHYLPFFQEKQESGVLRQGMCRLAKEKIVPGYMRWFTNHCDLVLAPSAGMQERIRENGTKAPTVVFPTGLEEAFYQKHPKEAEAIRRKYKPEGGALFCTTGRLEKEKNPEFLFQGIRELKRQLRRQFRVLLIGEGSMRTELEQRAEQMGIRQEICFVGNVPNTELNSWLQACDVFLFASKSETQGIVLAEAMAAGCPVAAVQASGVEDIVKNGINGFAVEEDPAVWAEKVRKIMKKENYLQMRKEAERTAEEYRAERLALYEESLYQECISARYAREIPHRVYFIG